MSYGSSDEYAAHRALCSQQELSRPAKGVIGERVWTNDMRYGVIEAIDTSEPRKTWYRVRQEPCWFDSETRITHLDASRMCEALT
jgi:hypothetical protein